MKREECMEKVRKLLALSESSNESEAMAALVKAKELMAKHMIERSEVEGPTMAGEEVKLMFTGTTFSKRRNPWTIDLAAVIGANFRCEPGRRQEKGKQTNEVFFLGLESDAEACKEIFGYAMRSVVDGINEIQKRGKQAGLDAYDRSDMSNGYGFGFVRGLADAFDEQKNSGEEGRRYDLAMSVPMEVRDFVDRGGYKRSGGDFSGRARGRMDVASWTRGYEDGREFKPGEKLNGSGRRESA